MQNTNAEQSYKTLLIIWAALLLSQFALIGLIWWARPEAFNFDFSKPVLGDNALIIVIFALFAVSNIAFSLIMRKKMLERSIAEQNIQFVQSALIIGCAFSEAISLFGAMLALAFNYQYFFLFSILGVIGILLHFPRREDVHAASYRK